MKYAYEDLSHIQFETLIVLLCQRLLGMSTQGFAEGPDGGRDAKFLGTAQLHPSTAKPWTGTTIIQAKHTNGYNRTFSDSDFYSSSSANTVIGNELPRIKKLRSERKLDHYMLFANRKLAGNAESQIRAHIAEECAIAEESIYLCGVDQLDLWLKQFPEVASLANLDPIDSPLIVSPDELAEVVEAISRHLGSVAGAIEDPPVPRVSYEAKNTLNNMTPEYAKSQRSLYLKETQQIRSFLALPENAAVLRMYETAANELHLGIVAKRRHYQTFDDVMQYLANLLFGRDVVLRRNKRLTRVMLFYMYWNCDIGVNGDAETQQAFTS